MNCIIYILTFAFFNKKSQTLRIHCPHSECEEFVILVIIFCIIFLLCVFIEYFVGRGILYPFITLILNNLQR